MILAGDVGATKTELTLYDKVNSAGKLKKIISEKYLSNDYKNIEEIIFLFMKDKIDKTVKIDSACIGIPGPVDNGRAKLTNLNWEINEKYLSEKLKINKFRLVNDLEAIATAVINLSENDENEIEVIYKGKDSDKKSNKVIIAPGTGLGQAALIYSESKYNVVATEGGHVDFAPGNETEIDLYKYLEKKYGHVSYERVISGMGIVNIFDFLKSINKFEIESELLNRILTEDAAAVISEYGLYKESKICEEVMNIFVAVLGSQAGNMVLNFKAFGGVYLAGGIPFKIKEKLKEKIFIDMFLNKGRLSYLLKSTPVYLIKNQSIGTYGAGLIAADT